MPCSEEQPWIKRIDNGDVVLSTLKLPDSKLWVVRTTVTIPVPVEKVWRMYNDKGESTIENCQIS